MDIMSKILAVIFSVITALGIIPRTVPKIVVLDDLKAEDTVITSDNPRTESPDEIISDILKGVDKNSRYAVISDRTEAIHFALDTASDGDVILLAGKGHEEYEIDQNGKHEYSERRIVLEHIGE